MKRTSGYSFRLGLALALVPFLQAAGQDTIDFPLRFGAGAGLFSPVSSLAGKYPRGFEAGAFYDLSERISLAAEGGYSRFVHENYNYRYENNGIYFRLGADYNLLNPVQASGKYYAGIGARYGLALFSHSSPFIDFSNFWGAYSTSAGSTFHASHFIEFTPGVRAELFRNLFIGWGVNLRLLVFGGTGKDMRAVDIPGFGNGSKPLAAGINYYISYRIPYRQKRVIYIKPERDTGDDDTVEGRPPGTTVRN